jgi:predicted RNA methylase
VIAKLLLKRWYLDVGVGMRRLDVFRDAVQEREGPDLLDRAEVGAGRLDLLAEPLARLEVAVEAFSYSLRDDVRHPDPPAVAEGSAISSY